MRAALVICLLDSAAETAKAFVEKEGYEWIHGFIGAQERAAIVSDYGAHAIPLILLIGPDGRVLAKRLSGEAIAPAVEKALGGFSPGGDGKRRASPGE